MQIVEVPLLSPDTLTFHPHPLRTSASQLLAAPAPLHVLCPLPDDPLTQCKCVSSERPPPTHFVPIISLEPSRMMEQIINGQKAGTLWAWWVLSSLHRA